MPSSSTVNDDHTIASPLQHFEPVSATVLLDRESNRRSEARALGLCATGCAEIDQQTLLAGGFERGSVVGISAEDEQISLLLALQTLARAVWDDPSLRAMVITTQPPGAIVPAIRDAIRAVQFSSSEKEISSTGNIEDVLPVESPLLLQTECLRRVALSRIFDVDGLLEILNELELAQVKSSERDFELRHQRGPLSEAKKLPRDDDNNPREDNARDDIPRDGNARDDNARDGNARNGNARVDNARNDIAPRNHVLQPKHANEAAQVEIPDSQDDEAASGSSASSPIRQQTRETGEGCLEKSLPAPQPAPSPSPSPAPASAPAPAPSPPSASGPSIIIVPQLSSLLTSHFTTHEKSLAHTTIRRLSAHLRRLSRTLTSKPLIILLNGTTTIEISSSSVLHDPALYSIFNTPTTTADTDADADADVDADADADANAKPSWRLRPSFGRTFAQLLDLHLLCTRMPKWKRDAETACGNEIVEQSWVVEVLLDDIGVWEGETRVKKKRREQRWGAVDVVDGRIVDAF